MQLVEVEYQTTVDPKTPDLGSTGDTFTTSWPHKSVLVFQNRRYVNGFTGDLRDLELQILASEFKRLSDNWRRERNPISSADDELFAKSEPYQQIIGLGPRIVPLLLQELRRDEPEPWFWALAAITRQNPVPAKSRGKLRETADAWLQWGFQ